MRVADRWYFRYVSKNICRRSFEIGRVTVFPIRFFKYIYIKEYRQYSRYVSINTCRRSCENGRSMVFLIYFYKYVHQEFWKWKIDFRYVSLNGRKRSCENGRSMVFPMFLKIHADKVMKLADRWYSRYVSWITFNRSCENGRSMVFLICFYKCMEELWKWQIDGISDMFLQIHAGVVKMADRWCFRYVSLNTCRRICENGRTNPDVL